MQGLDASPILLNNSRQNTETIKNETEVQSFTLEENPFEDLVTEIPEPKSLKTQKTPNNSYLIQPCSSHLETISELTQQNKLLQQKIRESREKLLKSEEKSHEYYEIYHNLIYEQRKSEQEKSQILKENAHIKSQALILRKYIFRLERKLTNKPEPSNFCEFELQENK